MINTINYNEKSKEELIELVNKQVKQISVLEELILAYRERQFGNKSEKLNTNQLTIFNEAILPKNPEKILEQEEEIQVASYQRKNPPGRKALPSDLPRVQRIYDLPDEEKICSCGCALTYITDEKSEQLEIIPAKVYVIEHIKKKYACRGCEGTIKTSKMPAAPIPRSIAASGLLSHVLVSKFQDYLPLYRQEKMLKRIGVDIPRSTLCLWVIRCAQLLKPLMNLMRDYIIDYDVAYCDETTVQVLKEPNKGVQSKKYMWLFAGGPPDKFVFYYQYHPSRSHSVAEEFFSDFKGYLHCDGYPGYDALSKIRKIHLVGCLYHARRKFFEVTKIAPGKEGIASEVIKKIAKISTIEEEIKSYSMEKKFEIRKEKAKPILDELHHYLVVNQPLIPPKSLLGQAVSYTLNQWPKLLSYLQDGRLENNNNRSERAIKPFVMGRKAWLFSDSVMGAHSAAIIYSMIETCKYHQVEPYDWLRYVLQKLPSCKILEEFEALLPFNIDKNLLNINVN